MRAEILSNVFRIPVGFQPECANHSVICRPSIVKSIQPHIRICLLVLLLCQGLLHAKPGKIWTDEQLYAESFLDITQGWATPQGKRVSFPWRLEGGQVQAFHKTISIPDSVLDLVKGDSLYFWVEGVSWEAEIVINGQYWAVRQTEGASWIVGIPMSVWREERLELILTIRLGKPNAFSPTPTLWVKPPICLLTRDQLDAFKPEEPEFVTGVDSVAIVPAFYRSEGWEFDGFEALRTLQPILDLRLRNIYFPFPADRRLKKICKQYGLRQVASLPEDGTVMWAAEYPFAAGMSPLPEAWWLDEEANRTKNYGVWLSMDRLVQLPGEPDGREGIVFILLGILLLLLFLKIFLPGMFGLQVGWLLPGSSGTNAGGDLSASLPGPLWLWITMKWLLWGLVITLGTLMLRDQGVWLSIRPDVTPGLAWRWLSIGNWLPGLIVRSILLIIGIDLIRYVLSFVGGIAFSLPTLVQAVGRLDMLSSFPLVYLMGIPWAAAMLYPEYGNLGVWLGGIFMVIHLLRMALVTASGLQQFFGFSAASIFLYICSLNVIPYLLLW